MVSGGAYNILRNLVVYVPALPWALRQRWRERRELDFAEPPTRWLTVARLADGVVDTEGGNLRLEGSTGWVRLRSPGSILPGVLVEEPSGHGKVQAQGDGRGGVSLSAPPLRLRLGTWSDPQRRGIGGWAVEVELAEHEHLYGLGERFASWDLGGRSHVLWSVDALADSVGSRAYKPIPLLVSCRGHGFFLHSTTRSLWRAAGGRLRIHVEGPLDLFILRGPAPARVLDHYTALTGRPAVPPRWSFGLWMSRCMYFSRKEVEGVARGLREHEVPCDVLNLDPLWLRGRRRLMADAFTGEWSDARFPRHEEMARGLRESGLRVCLWMNPYLPRGFPIHREAREKGLLPEHRGRPAGCMLSPLASPVDFTRSGASAWLGDRLEPLFRQGAAVMKTDYGEGAPPWATYAAGPGRQVHNLYPLLYNRAVFEATARVHARPMVWARSAWAGSQRYPVHWSGDTRCRWKDLPHVLQGGLNAAMSGLAHWSHDIGGFVGIPSDGLYTRWAQFGLFVSHARCHGITPREPWAFSGRTLAIFREHVKLRYRLIPYLYSCAHEAARTGLPLLRPMVLEFPGDPETHGLDAQYMLGPSLLVAPVLEEGATVKRLYLPAGLWTEWWSGEVRRGPGWVEVPAPLERLPILVREGTLLPLAPEGTRAEERPDPLFLEAFPDGDGNARLLLSEDDGDTAASLHRRDLSLRVAVGPGARDRTYEFRLRGAGPLASVEVEGAEGAGHGVKEGTMWIRFATRAGRGVKVDCRF